MTLVIASLFFINRTPCSGMQAKPSAQTIEFLRIARKEVAAGGELKQATTYLLGLLPAQQLQVAGTVVYDADARIAYLGANILIGRGRAQQAVPGLAAIIASGRNETQLNGRMGYDWVHSDDEGLFLRMAIMINRYLLANLSRYAGGQRARVEVILMGGLLEKPSMPFSKEEAEKLIMAWQSKLDKLNRESRRKSR